MTRLVACAALVALAVVGCQKQAPPPPPPPAKPDASVKAGDLLQEYAANSVAADAKYKDKILQVTGKFASATKAPLLGYSVQLVPEGGGEVDTAVVMCFIGEAAKDDVAKMQPGQTVTMQGRCDGGTLGQVKLAKCTVVK